MAVVAVEPLVRDRIVCADALAVVAATQHRFDTVFLDWPYSTMSPVRGRDIGAAGRIYGPVQFLHQLMVGLRRACVAGAHVYVFTDWRGIPDTGFVLSMSGWFPTSLLSCDKCYAGTGGTWRSAWEPIFFCTLGASAPRTNKALKNSFAVPSDRSQGRHPFQKPRQLWERLVEASVVPGSKTLDLFAGSGSSRPPVTSAGGEWYGVDIDAMWADTAWGGLG